MRAGSSVAAFLYYVSFFFMNRSFSFVARSS